MTRCLFHTISGEVDVSFIALTQECFVPFSLLILSTLFCAYPLVPAFCHLDLGRVHPEQSVATGHKDGGFVFRATRSIKKGEEIRACYGHFPNNELVLVYGFALDDNVDDGVILADGADETVAWFQRTLLEVCLWGPSSLPLINFRWPDTSSATGNFLAEACL